MNELLAFVLRVCAEAAYAVRDRPGWSWSDVPREGFAVLRMTANLYEHGRVYESDSA